jgi:hypothetical protein
MRAAGTTRPSVVARFNPIAEQTGIKARTKQARPGSGSNASYRWNSKEVFITEVLRHERIGLLPMPTGAFPGLLRNKCVAEFSMRKKQVFVLIENVWPDARKRHDTRQFPDCPSSWHSSEIILKDR